MSAAVLAVVLHNSSFLIDDGMRRMVSRTATASEALEFCTQFRRRGIASLLLRGAPEDLRRDLSFSGRAFQHVLPSIPDEVRATGLQTPFFDAVAAGDLPCGLEIARASRSTWNPGEELEDDFLYVSILMSFVLGSDDGNASAAAVSRYQVLAAKDQKEDSRLSICLGLLGRDTEAFNEALANLLAETKKRYRHLAQKMVITDEEAATEGCFSTEGMALVRIARLAGLSPRLEYSMIPSLAWRGTSQLGAPDSWMSSDR